MEYNGSGNSASTNVLGGGELKNIISIIFDIYLKFVDSNIRDW